MWRTDFSPYLLVHISCDFCTNCFLQDGFLAFVRLGSKVWRRLGKSEMNKALYRYGFFTVFVNLQFVTIFTQVCFLQDEFLAFVRLGSKVWRRLGKSEMAKAYGHSELDTIICISKKKSPAKIFFLKLRRG